MQYHFVVVWSKENGWEIDWESTIARFRGENVFIPNLNEWIFPVHNSETGDKEKILSDQLLDLLNNSNLSKDNNET